MHRAAAERHVVRTPRNNMRGIMIKIPVLLTTAVAVMALACGDTESPTANIPRTGIESILKIVPEDVRIDGSIEIFYEIKNYGPDTLTFGFPTPFHFGFVVETPGADKVHYPCCYMHPYYSEFELLPGESRKYTITFWCNADANDGSYWPPDLDRLPVGTHKIAGGLIGYKEDCPWPEKEFRVIE